MCKGPEVVKDMVCWGNCEKAGRLQHGDAGPG